MDDCELLYGALILIVGSIFFMLIAFLTKDMRNKKLLKNSEDTEAKRWLDVVKKLYDDNEFIEFINIYEKCGMPSEIANSKNPDLISQNIPFLPDSKEIELFDSYNLAIDNRYRLRMKPLTMYNPEDYQLNLKLDEILYYVDVAVILYEEKTIMRNYSYSGYRWTSGPLRAGELSVSANDIKDYLPQDVGNIYITNERVIFVGEQKKIVKAISLGNVLTYDLYMDGIRISQPNKKALLFKFTSYDDKSLFISAGITEFITVLDRVLKHTENENLCLEQK